MNAFQIFVTVFLSFIVLALLIKVIAVIRFELTHMHINYKKLTNYRSEAYKRLGNALSSSSISMNEFDTLYHNLFFSSIDFFKFRALLSDAEKRTFWFSENTSICLREYISVLDSSCAQFGLTPESDDRLFQEFGLTFYQTFELYQTNLINSIHSDVSTVQTVRFFLSNKYRSAGKSANTKVIAFTPVKEQA